MTGSIAKRYARALASVASEQNTLEDVEAQLDKTAAWLADPELSAALASPALDSEARQGLIAKITESLELSELAKNFLDLLARSQRLDHFAGIVRAYRSIVDDQLGRMRGTIHTATPLEDAAVQNLAAAFEKTHGKKVLLDVEIDAALIGGISVEIGGRVYDGSVRTQLRQLRKKMTQE